MTNAECRTGVNDERRMTGVRLLAFDIRDSTLMRIRHLAFVIRH